MMGPRLAREIMVTKLVTLTPGMDVFEAIGLLLKHKISGAPVIDENGAFVGVFSEKSCMRMVVKAAYEQLPTTQLFAFVETDARTIDEETDLLTIAQIFLSTSARRLPVLNDGKLVGQVSRRDVLRDVHAQMAVGSNDDSQLLYLSSIMERDEAPIA